MARTGPACPICGKSGVYAGRFNGIYIPPAGHMRRMMSLTDAVRTPAGRRIADVVYDLCPLLDGDESA